VNYFILLILLFVYTHKQVH